MVQSRTGQLISIQFRLAKRQSLLYKYSANAGAITAHQKFTGLINLSYGGTVKRTALVLVFCLCLGLGCAWGDNFFCCSSYTVDWSQLGPSFSVLSTPQAWTTFGGPTGLVGVEGGGTFERLDQGNGWNGNFLPGSALIWNQGHGDFLFAFDTPVAGVGMAVQADLYGPFVATLSLYDSSLNLLHATVMNGVSNPNADGSAIFISWDSASSDIFYARINVKDWQGGGSMAACTMSLKPDPGRPPGIDPCTNYSPTPEPGSLPLLGTGVLGVIWTIRRKLL